MAEIFYKSSSESSFNESQPNCISYLAVFLSNYQKILLYDNSNLPVAQGSSKSAENSANFDKSDILKIYKGYQLVSYEDFTVVFVHTGYIVAKYNNKSIMAPFILYRIDFDNRVFNVKKLGM
jgi:hypothetical protein